MGAAPRESAQAFSNMDDDMEDYGFEYSDEEPEQEDVDIENQYYNSKGMIENGTIDCALKGFASVISMEPEKGEWGFRALKQCVMLYFKAGDFEQMMKSYQELLTYVKTAVTRNYSEKIFTKERFVLWRRPRMSACGSKPI